MAVTVPVPSTSHLLPYVLAAVVAVALVLAVFLGYAIGDSNSSPAATGGGDSTGVSLDLPGGRYGSADAAEEHNR
jgi:hypothetical protein